MENCFSRTEMLIGTENLRKLQSRRVAVFGIGGVGGYAAEALVRSGIGAIDIIDNDTVDITNINRQIIATVNTVGMRKTDAAAQRILSINPEIKLTVHDLFFDKESSVCFDFQKYDYIVDAIDTVTSKIELILKADVAGTPIISCMGTGNKLDPCKLQISDIYKTSVCPLARVMRYELKKRGIKKLKAVYSTENPLKPNIIEDSLKASTPGSTSFVPACAGLIIASEVIKDLLSKS